MKESQKKPILQGVRSSFSRLFLTYFWTVTKRVYFFALNGKIKAEAKQCLAEAQSPYADFVHNR
jgi:hypothetical protein